MDLASKIGIDLQVDRANVAKATLFATEFVAEGMDSIKRSSNQTAAAESSSLVPPPTVLSYELLQKKSIGYIRLRRFIYEVDSTDDDIVLKIADSIVNQFWRDARKAFAGGSPWTDYRCSQQRRRDSSGCRTNAAVFFW